ncbi:MAG: aminomethyl-transferring glycine dehydrogenase subunit GcvPA [bacterium]
MVYTPNTGKDRRHMMEKLGVASVEELFANIPSSVRLKGDIDLPKALSEIELTRHMYSLGKKNRNLEDDIVCFIGAGAYDHFIPSVVSHISARSEFYTAYTPYQPELSQGTLQAMFEYQTFICKITGMYTSNASLYDGATAVVEAANMSIAFTKRKKVVISSLVHPEYRTVLDTYASAGDFEVVGTQYSEGKTDISQIQEVVDENTACVIVQNPNFLGSIEDLSRISEVAHAKGALFVVSMYPISSGLLKLPGDCGADIVVGEGQSLGIPISFGGPYLGIFACSERLRRYMPGRVTGITSDANGRRGYVLTLQTREQHIRREKATSNICSNEALCALSACVYIASLGKKGLKQVAELCVCKAHYLSSEIADIKGLSLKFNTAFFNEFVIKVEKASKKGLKYIEKLNRELLKRNILSGLPLGRIYPELSDCILFCVTEKRSKEQMDSLVKALKQLISD